MAPQLISIIGCLNADLIMMTKRIPDPGESFKAREYLEGLGGKGANSAIATYRSCHRRPPTGKITSADSRVDENDENEIEVCMIGAVGDDQYGSLFVSELQANGVDVAGLRRVEGMKSGICFILVEVDSGENRCIFATNANDTLTVADFAEIGSLASGRRPDLVISQMELDRPVVEQMILTAADAKVDFLLNAAPANPILTRLYPLITHLLVNEAEAATMSGRPREDVNKTTWQEIAQDLLKRGAKNVVITLGAQGAYFAREGEYGHIPAFAIKVVDCTGAGDTFTGAYATEYLRQKRQGRWDIEAAVIHACKAAALTITKVGAQEGIPWMDEIEAFSDEDMASRPPEDEAAPSAPVMLHNFLAWRDGDGNMAASQFPALEAQS